MSANVLRGLLWSTLLLLSNATLANQNLLSNGDFEKPGFSFTPAPYWMATNDYRHLNPGPTKRLPTGSLPTMALASDRSSITRTGTLSPPETMDWRWTKARR